MIIQAPTSCPSCSYELEWSNHLLYCRNSSCLSKVGKKIEHFAKTLKIKGLGPSSIAKLNLADVDEIYMLSEEGVAQALSSSRLAEKLCKEIENSKNASLNLLLPAFSIPLIGKTAADKLSTVCKSIFDIDEDSCKSAGLGPKATANLLDWLSNDFNYYKEMPFSFKFESAEKPSEKKGVVCISGKLKSFKTKAEAEKVLESHGFEVKSSLTKEVTILINESGIESSKTQKARESGILIVNNLVEFIGEI